MAEGRSTPSPPAGAAESAWSEVLARVDRIRRENQQLFEKLAHGERRYRALAKSVWQVQEEERRRLARDLHDGIGQTLTALKNELELAAREAPARGAPAGRLRDAIDLAARALQDTRELSRLLRPPVLDDLGLEAALSWLARTFGERSGLRIGLRTQGLDGRLEPELETLVFRLAQEALTNVLKHAAADRAEIDVACGGETIHLLVRDSGRGFDPESVADAGCGLTGMRDRVELFGGRFAVRSSPGSGTTIEARVPRRGQAGAE